MEVLIVNMTLWLLWISLVTLSKVGKVILLKFKCNRLQKKQSNLICLQE